MYTSNETLRELDAILKPAFKKAVQQVKRSRYSQDSIPKHLAHAMKREIDNTRVALSEKLYHIELAMNGYEDRLEQTLCEWEEQMRAKNPYAYDGKITPEDFVQENKKGFLIYDGFTWHQVSKKTNISLTIESSPESMGEPAVHLFVYDPLSGKRYTYIDNEKLSARETAYLYDKTYSQLTQPVESISYTDPLLSAVQNGSGGLGTVAGSLEAFSMSQHYRHQINNPFVKGANLVDGKWKALDGQWHNFKELDQADNAFKQNSLKTSKHWAEVRGTKAANAWKWTGRICFFISTVVGGVNIYNAHVSNDSNKNNVYAKNSLDITMGLVAFIPGFGWAVSGTYFILDASGVFGSWGQASGYSTTEVQNMQDRSRIINNQKLYEIDFEIPYEEPQDKALKDLRELRTQAIDNTYVKKTLYKTFH